MVNVPTGGTRIIAVSGVKNSGKTTMVCALIKELTSRGLSVGAIKHEGHEFEPDVPDTDSFRMRKSGAKDVAIFSENRVMIIKENSGMTEEEIMKLFPDDDIILLEGFKYSDYTKIEVFRVDNSDTPVCEPDTMLALATDCPGYRLPDRYSGVPLFGLSDYSSLADVICRLALCND